MAGIRGVGVRRIWLQPVKQKGPRVIIGISDGDCLRHGNLTTLIERRPTDLDVICWESWRSYYDARRTFIHIAHSREGEMMTLVEYASSVDEVPYGSE